MTPKKANHPMASNKNSKDVKHKNKKKARISYNTKLLVLLFGFGVISICAFIYIQSQLDSPGTIVRHQDVKKYSDLEKAVIAFGGVGFSVGKVFEKPFWGTLNSGHYFGVKLGGPNPIETSLIWFEHAININGGLDVRHLCNQNDGIKSYSWNRHDFYNFGQQSIEDKNYRIKTSFIKNPDNELEWKARIEVENVAGTNAISKPLSLIQYITTSHPDDKLNLIHNDDNSIIIGGFSNVVEEYVMSIKFNSDKDKLISSGFIKGNIDKMRVPISSYIGSKLERVSVNGTSVFQLKNSRYNRHFEDLEKSGDPNIIGYQLNVIVPCTLEISFTQGSDESESNYKFEPAIEAKIANFEKRFASKFKLNNFKLTGNQTIGELQKMSKVSLSNMLGSIGYFHGVSIIGNDPTNNRNLEPYGPIELLTAVPSRSFFPRGFLWDEAFHNLLISHWEPKLSNIIIKSWFDIMNVNGWIPREVILGMESMNRVPREFIVQYIMNANPPAMFIVLDRMFEQKTLDIDTFNHIYPRLKTWYNWFDVTQSGMKPSTYRWRGRDELSVNLLNPKTLTSGLDDYPRSSHPSPQEYHIDLRCWMTLALKTLYKFAKLKGDTEFSKEIKLKLKSLDDQSNLDRLHWSDEHKMYCDFGHNTQNVELVKVTKYRNVQYGDGVEEFQEYQRVSTGQPQFGCVPEFGYVSLFPLIFNLIEANSDKLGIILDRLTDPNELWSQYGIRSLSMRSRYYNKYNSEHDKPYWRGAVWINLNYLILSSLHKYSQIDGPYAVRCQTIFEDLRQNLVNNVLSEFTRTNYIWEQYNDQTGQGQGSHPFTGWSSLVSMIASSDWSI